MSDTSTRVPDAKPSTASKLISASAIMAAGTLTSRILGFGRLMLLVLLFGNGTRQADMFTFANTVPNSMYILLAGGVLNTVLVPQIVRAVKGDPDGGAAYTNRIMTAGLMILGVITVALTFAAPLIIRLYTPQGWHTPGRAAQYDSMVTLAYYCLPQVFFYGVHVLAGQVLNARDKFGPMMWAPIANNVISILVLLLFVLVFGQGDRVSAFSTEQELLLGLGSTLGIAAQAAVLVPFLRSSGYRFRPRFDFKHTGLGHTFALAKWTLGFVVVTQAALVVVYRLAGRATAGGEGAGLTVYSNAYAVWILPHSLITVSLATAMLPAASRLAAAGDLRGVRNETMRTMRLAATALLPTAVALVALGQPIAQLAFGFGRGEDDAHLVGWALMALAIGLVPFTIQYVCLRAYYSLEDTRTTFFLQLVISGVHVTLALTVVTLLDRPSLVATGLAFAYAGAYTLGVLVSFRVLGRRLPGLSGAELARHCLRLLVAATPAGLAAYAISSAFASRSDSRPVLALALVTAGVVAVPVFLLMARLLHIGEVNDILGTFLRRKHGAGASVAVRLDDGMDQLGDGGDPGSPGDSTALMTAPSPTIETARTATPGPPGPGGPMETTKSMVSQPGGKDSTRDTSATAVADPDDHEAGVVAPVAATMPAGTVLAHRYRLEELLAESEPTVTWRAFDQVLSRSVLVHLLPPLDVGATDLLAAARNASVATDSRFLRVLDAIYSDDPRLGSYIVCEYATGQSLGMILSHGSLSGLEAAWVVREVADALSGVHVYGLYHGRINPETVIITPAGNVKIVGLMIEAVLKPNHSSPVHGASSPELVDVLDLGRLLYAALVSRWPGGPGYGMPDAPVLGRRWMTPRQVRAGVSPALDAVCDQILGDPPRHRAPQLRSANDVVNALTKVLGSADASGDLERRLRQPVPRVGTQHSSPVSSLLDQRTEHRLRIGPDPADDGGQLTERMAKIDLPPGRPRTSNAPPVVPPEACGPQDERSSAWREVANQPGRMSPPPARMATNGTEASQTTLIRQPPPPAGRDHAWPAMHKHATSSRGPSTRRRRRWIALAVLLGVLLIVAGLVSAAVITGRSPLSSRSASQPPTVSTQPSTASPPVALTVAGARDFDPQGNPNTENPQLVKNAYDGKPETRWQTVTYYHNPRLGGLKRGVGLVLDLGQPQRVGSVDLSLSGTGTSVQVRVPKESPDQIQKPPMSSDSRWRTVSEQSRAKQRATLEFKKTVTSRFVLVYLTSLPKDGNGYRGGIYEVQVYS
jgi:putative peptidoglycan lipid II flippase